MSADLEQAWRAREGWLKRLDALRVFHGPGEGQGPWRDVAIDRFAAEGAEDYWVTYWGEGWERIEKSCAEFLRSKGARSSVVVTRPEKGVAPEARVFLGEPPESSWVKEGLGTYKIRFHKTRHPGLFLDHEPLRGWLIESARGWKVLNTFAYTGSLSVAAGLGKAAFVTTLDLSKPSIEWAKENWSGNSLREDQAKFIAGDVFEWLPRLKRGSESFDCVILDPPSFSRGKKGNFSTAKDLPKLHRAALELVASGGYLITSINSANVSPARFESDVAEAAGAVRCKLKVVKRIALPETFPAKTPLDRYLKGAIYQVAR